MRKTSAILAAKLTAKLTRLSSGGTALPGLVAERLDPSLLNTVVGNNFPKGVVFVTGTNGKTTTTRLISKILSDNGLTIVTNKAGSNLPRGILASLLAQSDSKGRIKADMAVLEVDEGYFPQLLVELRPKIAVVTNIFRDQLDRYGEVDAIVQAFSEAFKLYSPEHIILNADDPLVYSIAHRAKLKAEYFGINSYPRQDDTNDYAPDMVDDPIAHKELIYSQRYFSHIGKYRSIDNKFKRPEPLISANKVVISNKHNYNIVVSNTTEEHLIHFPLLGLYNIYNLLAAIAVSSSLGIDLQKASASCESISEAFGRAEQQIIHGKQVTTLLIKNPTGFNQVIANFLLSSPTKPILFVINDKLADGRDISWLWDTSLESLKSDNPIIVSGTRAYDMALRLKYAGVETVEIVPKLEDALAQFTNNLDENGGYIVLTYTALLALQKYLHKHNKKGKWS